MADKLSKRAEILCAARVLEMISAGEADEDGIVAAACQRRRPDAQRFSPDEVRGVLAGLVRDGVLSVDEQRTVVRRYTMGGEA